MQKQVCVTTGLNKFDGHYTNQPPKCIELPYTLRARLGPLNRFNPQLLITDRSKALDLLWFTLLLYFYVSFGTGFTICTRELPSSVIVPYYLPKKSKGNITKNCVKLKLACC